MAANRVALVTGGTRGIGAAIVKRLAADGFSVFLSGRTEASTKSALARFAKEGLSVRGFAADARSEEDQKRLVQSVARDGGRLDVLVNNAGLGHFDRVDKLSADQFRETLETNLFGVFYAVHHAAPLMIKNGGGFIVNIASLASVNPFADGVGLLRVEMGAHRLHEEPRRRAERQRPRDARNPAGLRRHGVRPLAPRCLLDARARGRGRGRRRPRALPGPRDPLAHRPAPVEAAEEITTPRASPSG